MNFNQHYNLKDKHAFLSPSSFHWLNYDADKIRESYDTYKAAERGTKLHAFAATCIELKQHLPKSKKTLNAYVNDAIGFNMTPEQCLYYSDNCFGTCDAICFRNNFLRIHDLKTGSIPAHIEQLYIYAALFCLEYKISPGAIGIEVRLYQNDEIIAASPSPELITDIMNIIIKDSKIIDSIKEKAD